MSALGDYLKKALEQETQMALQQAEVQRAIDQQKKENTTKALDAIKSLALSNTERQIAQTTAKVQAQQAAQESAKTTLQKYLDKAESAAVQNTQRQIEQTQAQMKAQQEAGTTLQKYLKSVTEKPTDALSVAAREERSARKELNAALEQQARLADAGAMPNRQAQEQQQTALQKYISAGKKLEEAGGIAGTDMTIGNLAQYGSSLANYLVSTARQMGTDSLQQSLRAAQESFAAAGDTDTAMELEKTIQAAEDELNTRGALQKALDRGAQWGQEQMAAAKVGRSEAGKFLIDLAMQGEQMAVDAALGGVVGARLLPMYMRASGAGEQEAVSEGADARSALLYGNAVGAVEALTEKMYDGVSGIFGKGAADKVVEDFVNRVAGDKLGRAALQTFFNFAGEAGEELVSGLIDPALQSIYNGKSIGESWSTLEVSELLYDAFVGGVMGLLGGSAEVMMNYNAPLGEQVDTRPINERVRDTLRDPEALREYIAKYGKLGDTKTEAGRRLSQIMQQEEKRAKELREIELELKSGKKGSLTDETADGIKTRKLNARQKVGLHIARTLAEMGNNIHVYQSENVNGEWVLPENLREKMGRYDAPNGWYDTETGDIWVDLNAGKDGRGTMAYTLAHEITHKIKARGGTSFEAIKDFLNGVYGLAGVSVEELAQERVAEAAAKGKTLDMETAVEEVVADSMETMFTDARAMDRIDALKAKNQSAWKNLRDNVRRWVRNMDMAYASAKPETAEGRAVKAMKDYVDELAEMFAEGTVKAGVSREKGEESGVRNSHFSERTTSGWVATMQEARQKLNGGNKYSFTTDNGNEFVIRALPQLDGTVTASITKNGEMLISGSYGSKNEAISVLIGEAQQNDGRKLNGMEATWADAGEDPDQLIGTPGGMERAGDRVYSKAEAKPASEKLIEFEDGAAIPEESFSAAIREAFPNRIDKAQAQEIAEKNDYPKLQRLDGKEPQQVIPYYTFVKVMDRGNYGLITSWDPYQGFGVQFINKEAGIARFRYFPANELRAVDARYSDPDGNWWKVEDPGEPVRAESADMAAETKANVETLKEFNPGGEEEMGFERPKAKDKNRLYDPDFQINTENDSESMTEKRKQAAEAEYRTLTTTRSRTQSEIKVLEGLEKIAGTQLTEAQREHLDDLRETLQAYTDELKTRKAPVQEEVSVKTMPTEAARSAANKLLKMMEIQAGTRAEGRAILDDMFRRFVETGKLTETDIETAFYALLEKGISVQEEQSYSGMLYRELKGTKIYVSEKTKADFTDYADFRKQAMAAGLTLTNDTNAYSIDQLTAELTETWGDMFEADAAPGDQLRNLLEIMEQGKTRNIPKLEAVAQEAAEAHIDVEEAIEDYLSEFRTAAKQFAEAAKIEIAAKDKAAKAMAEQRAYLEKAEEKRKQRNRERELQNRVMAQMKKLSRMGKKTSNAQKAAIAELIGDIDLMAKSISKTGIESLEALQRDYEQRKAEAGWVDENSPGNWLGDNYSEQKLARLGKKHVKEMSVSELLELGNAVSHMITQIENQNKLVDDERQRKISETAKQMRSELAGARGIEQNRASTKLKEFLSFEQLGGRRVFDMLGGWKDGAWHDLGLALEKGGVDQLAFTKAAFDEVKPWMEANKSWLKTASGKNAKWIEYTVPAILGAAEDGTPITGEVTFEITPMMRAELLLHSKNTDNLRHIAEGGIVIPDKRAYIKGDKAGMYSAHRKVRLSPEIVRMIANSASPQEVSFAEVMQRFMDGTSKDAINSVSMLLDGFERAGVGAYWPLNTDKTFNKSDAGREAMAGTVEGIGSIANERVRGANTPIILQDAYETFVNSVNNTSRYYGYAIPVRNFNALWNYTFRMTGDPQSDSIKALLDRKWGTEANRYLKKIVDDVQGANGRKNDMTGRVLNRLRSGMAGATLMFNPSVAFSQAASYPAAGATLSTAALLHGLNPATEVDPQLIQKYTPVYWSRGDQSADTTMLEGEGYKRDLGQKAPALFGWIQGMDQLTIRRLWAACDYEVSHKADTRELTGDAHYEAVAALFNKAVHDTQPNYTTFERSQLLRSDNELTRTLTMFKTVSQQYYGVMFEAQARLSQARSEYKAAQARGDADAVSETEGRLKTAKKDWARGMSSIFGANAMYVVIKALSRAVKGTDKDYRDENGEYTWQTIAAGLGKDLAEVTAGSVMLGDELYSYAEKMINGGKWEPPEISALGTLADFANALGSLAQIGKYGAQDAAGRIREAAMTLATAMGVPAKNMESWTLAFAKFVSPEATTAYENFFDEKTKTDVQKLSGRRLETGVKTVLQNRFGSEESAEEITRLVAAGYADALPKAIPADFEWSSTDEKGNATKHEVALTYGTREKYRQAWTKAAELDELLNSKVYQNADDKAKAAMIRGLYDYATQVAREAVSDYEMDGTNAKIREANAAGISTATYLSFYYSIKDIQSDKDANGKSISGSAAYKKTVALREMRLSDKETDYLARTIASEACINDYDKVKDYMSFDVWALIYNTYQMTDSKNEKGISVNGLKKKRMEEYLAGMAISDAARKACMSLWYKDYSLPEVKKVTGKSALAKYMELPTGKEGKTNGKSALAKYMELPTVKETTGKSALAKYMELPTIK